MVARAPAGSLAPKWTPLGFIQRLRRIVQQPGDLALLLRMAHFLWTAPARLGRSDLPGFLDDLGRAPRPPAETVAAGVARIARLRHVLLRLPALRTSNTCYLRALTLYRFLDAGGRRLRIHFGVEPGMDPKDRLSGHAWISVDGEIIEPPDPVVQGRVREIYGHPPVR